MGGFCYDAFYYGVSSEGATFDGSADVSIAVDVTNADTATKLNAHAINEAVFDGTEDDATMGRCHRMKKKTKVRLSSAMIVAM